MNRLIYFRKSIALFLVVLLLACFGPWSAPNAFGVVPAPDGAYPSFTTAEGQNALQRLTTGAGNTALGWRSLFLDTTGSFNTGVGAGALFLNTADNNTATGAGSLSLNTIGVANTATGAFALFSNTTGNFNTGTGFFALHDNTTGSGITGYGASALQHNSTGNFNTAVGNNALDSNTTGGNNTATGINALFSNTTGNGNTAIGSGALPVSTLGDGNTAVGWDALFVNTTGSENVAIGDSVLVSNTSGSNNTAIGVDALLNNTTGTGNVALGESAGSGVTFANNVIAIGAGGANVSGTCFIGNIRGITTENNNAVPVLIDSVGQLGTISSSRRYKKEIKPMDKASEAILALKPVTFRYKVHKDTTPQFGLIAEDVAEINPDLVIYDPDGKPYTVRYDAVNAMLLNEFLKEHKKVEQLQATVAQQQKDFQAVIAKLKETVTAQLNEQAAQIQKVSAQLELSKPAPQTVLNNQ